MILSAQELAAARNGEAVKAKADDLDVVILRADVFERLQSGYSAEPLTKAERLQLLHAAGQRANWDDPELDVYEQYRP